MLLKPSSALKLFFLRIGGSRLAPQELVVREPDTRQLVGNGSATDPGTVRGFYGGAAVKYRISTSKEGTLLA